MTVTAIDRTDACPADGMAGPFARRNGFRGSRVHGQIVRTLAGWVLGGRLGPGDALPNEEELAAQFGVSRSSVREAVKTLSAKGLIATRQRVGARVRPRGDWRLLDPAVLSWHPDIRRDAQLVSSLVEARRIIEPAAAELAATRASAADLARIEAAYQAMERAVPHDVEGCCTADLAFHCGIVEASGNLVLQGLIGIIEATLRASLMATNRLMHRQAAPLACHRDVLDNIRTRDPAGARASMSRVLDRAAEDLNDA